MTMIWYNKQTTMRKNCITPCSFVKKKKKLYAQMCEFGKM